MSAVRPAEVSQRHLCGLLQAIDELPPAEAQRLRMLLTSHGLAEIEASNATWQPVERLVAWVEAIERGTDRRRLETLFHRFAFVESKASILRSFVGGALRLFGSGGRVLARKIPSGMTLMYRHLGRISERGTGAQEHEIILDELPSVCAESAAYVAAVGAYYQGLFDVLKVAGGKVVLAEHETGKARAVYRCSWS